MSYVVESTLEKIKGGRFDVMGAVEMIQGLKGRQLGLLTYWYEHFVFVVHADYGIADEDRKYLELLDLHCMPLLSECVELLSDNSLWVAQYTHCEGEMRVPLSEFKGKVPRSSVERALAELEELHDMGYWHQFAHLGWAHWSVFLPSGTFVLDQWYACVPLDYLEDEPLDELLNEVEFILSLHAE